MHITMPPLPGLPACVQDRLGQLRQTQPLSAFGVEVGNVEPAREGTFQFGPVFVDGCIPCGIPIASLVDRRLAEYALVGKAESLCRRP